MVIIISSQSKIQAWQQGPDCAANSASELRGNTSQLARGEADAINMDVDPQLSFLQVHPNQDFGHFIEQILYSAAV